MNNQIREFSSLHLQESRREIDHHQGLQTYIKEFDDVLENVGASRGLTGSFISITPTQCLVDSRPNTKEWHNEITHGFRNHLVHKVVQAIFPITDVNQIYDRRMTNLNGYARKIEGDFFVQANSRSEYYRLLAEKIFKIQKELNEKRQKRREQQAEDLEYQTIMEHNETFGEQEE